MLGKIASLNTLRTFEVAARRSSFTKAAEELHMTQGAVSHQIRQLEAQIGIQLFRRETRKISLTDAGERLYRATRRALLDIDTELAALAPEPKIAQLSVAVSTYVAIKWLSPRLGGFFLAHPDVMLQLHHNVNEVDFDIARQDFAIRWGKGPWPGAASCELLPMPMLPLCAPALANAVGGLRTAADLRHVTLLHDHQSIDLWPAWLAQAGIPPNTTIKGRTILDPVVRIQAAIDGQGVILADDLAQGEITSGRLVAPFDIALDGYGYHLLWSENTELSQNAAAFRVWVMDQASVAAKG